MTAGNYSDNLLLSSSGSRSKFAARNRNTRDVGAEQHQDKALSPKRGHAWVFIVMGASELHGLGELAQREPVH